MSKCSALFSILAKSLDLALTSQCILQELIDRLAVLQQAMHIFTDARKSSGLDETVFIFENPIKAAFETALDAELAAKMNISDVRNITDNFSSRLTNRMNLTPRSGAGAGRTVRAHTIDEPDFDPRESTAGLEFLPPPPGELDPLNPDFVVEKEEGSDKA